ncbi:MAG TPA: hypothetical protein VLX31_03870 [Streptosporangiaceae bacterium]|nr:hypothetical protein [Streptosporangiaceae bacterium]
MLAAAARAAPGTGTTIMVSLALPESRPGSAADQASAASRGRGEAGTSAPAMATSGQDR